VGLVSPWQGFSGLGSTFGFEIVLEIVRSAEYLAILRNWLDYSIFYPDGFSGLFVPWQDIDVAECGKVGAFVSRTWVSKRTGCT